MTCEHHAPMETTQNGRVKDGAAAAAPARDGWICGYEPLLDRLLRPRQSQAPSLSGLRFSLHLVSSSALLSFRNLINIERARETARERRGSVSLNESMEVGHILIGLDCGRTLEAVPLADSARALPSECNFDIQAFPFTADKELLREPRVVRVRLKQNSIALPTTAPFLDEKRAIHQKVKPMINAAGASGVNILYLREAWMMPFAFCTGEKRETIWNTTVIIDNHGNIIGKHQKNLIPRVGDFNENTYYMEGNTGHPVFETAYGKIAVNNCCGGHHPLNW